MVVNISFKQVKEDVTKEYHKTLRGWNTKQVEWSKLKNVVSKSNIQYSPYAWTNGVKIPKLFDRSKQNMLTIDVDNGMTISRFQTIFRKYKYCLSTTKSHQKDKKGIVTDRYRINIPAINIPEDDDVYFRTLELAFPYGDEQTLTKTASFLGCNDCIVIYNDGDTLDLYKASMLAKQQLDEEFKETVVVDRDFINSSGSSLDDVKSQLTVDIVKEVLESIGIDIVGNKCRLRDDDRTVSAKIYPSGYIKDYGCSDSSGDIFKILQDKEGMSFKESINYVRNFI